MLNPLFSCPASFFYTLITIDSCRAFILYSMLFDLFVFIVVLASNLYSNFNVLLCYRFFVISWRRMYNNLHQGCSATRLTIAIIIIIIMSIGGIPIDHQHSSSAVLLTWSTTECSQCTFDAWLVKKQLAAIAAWSSGFR